MPPIVPTDIKFYKADPSTGGLNINQPEIVKINGLLFPKIKIPVKRKHIAYRKIYVYNQNTGNQFGTLLNPVLTIVDNPYNFYSMAVTKPGSSLPGDADDINVHGGSGPDAFTAAPLTLPNIKANDGVSFWIRRFIFWTQNDKLYLNFNLNLHGQSDD